MRTHVEVDLAGKGTIWRGMYVCDDDRHTFGGVCSCYSDQASECKLFLLQKMDACNRRTRYGDPPRSLMFYPTISVLIHGRSCLECTCRVSDGLLRHA